MSEATGSLQSIGDRFGIVLSIVGDRRRAGFGAAALGRGAQSPAMIIRKHDRVKAGHGLVDDASLHDKRRWSIPYYFRG